MKASIAAIILSAAAAAQAQVTIDPDTNEFKCAKPNVAYCASGSLNSNIIIRCDASGKGQPGNCNNNLAGVPPSGVKTDALCYESAADAGDAACSIDGKAYPDGGEPFPIPGGEEPYPTETESSYPTETESSYPTETETSYPTETESSYPTETESSYPTETESSYPTDTEVPPTDTPCPTDSHLPPYPSGTDYPPHPMPTGSYSLTKVYPTGVYPPGPTGTGTGAPNPTGGNGGNGGNGGENPTWAPTASPPLPEYTGAAAPAFGSASFGAMGLAGAFAAFFL